MKIAGLIREKKSSRVNFGLLAFFAAIALALASTYVYALNIENKAQSKTKNQLLNEELFRTDRVVVKFKALDQMPKKDGEAAISSFDAQELKNYLSGSLPASDIQEVRKLYKGKVNKAKVQQELETLVNNKGTKTNSQILREEKLKKLLNADTLKAQYGIDRTFVIDLDKTDLQGIRSIIAKLRTDPNIEYAEPDYKVKLQMVPNDPYYFTSNSWGQGYDDLWGIKKIQSASAWDLSQGQGVVVAVIDTGVDYNHEDLVSNMWVNSGEIPDNEIDDDENGYVDDVYGWDFAISDNDPMDDNGHGTHCSGIIAAIGNNTLGVIGVAPQAKIMAMKGLSADGSGYESDLANCIYYAVDNGADILSNSWGRVGIPTPLLLDVFGYAYGLGCVSLAAAGNSNLDVTFDTPAGIEDVIAVAASNQNDERCNFSNYGLKIDVSAPGGDSLSGDGDNLWGRNILSLRSDNNGNPTDMYGDGICIIGQKYYRARGTSMACPNAAGAAALIRSLYPQDSPDAIRSRLQIGADNIDALNPGFEGLLGSGRVNSYSALSVEAQPNLKLLAIEKDSIIPGGNATVVAYIKNYWQDALNATATLSTTSSKVTIQDNQASLGDILTGQTRDNSQDPFDITLAEDLDYGEVMEFELTINASGAYQKVFPFSITMAYFEDVGVQTNLPLSDLLVVDTTMQDYNNDGYADLHYAGAWDAYLYRNNQNGSFINSTDESGVTFLTGAMKSIFFDINNDGEKDIFIEGTAEIKLYLNDGDGTFTDISVSSGLSDIDEAVVAITFNYDNNSFIDLIIGTYGEVLILKNNGDNTFTDVTQQSGVDCIGFGGGGNLVSFDYDNDNDQDLLISSPEGYTNLFRNNNNGTFTDVTDQTGIDSSYGSDGLTAGDYNNDGNIDIFLTSYNGGDPNNSNIFYRNNGDGTFTDITLDVGDIGSGTGGFTQGNDFLDYDNDGDLDLYLTNILSDMVIGENSLYQNNADGTFTFINHLAFPQEVKPGGAAAAISDYDNDGSLDIYAPGGLGLPGGFLKNRFGVNNNWIRIRLVGVESNRDAYGARVYLKTGTKTQLREVHTGAVETQPLHFGLGQASTIDEIEVRWPSGIVQKFQNVGINQLLTIEEAAVAIEGPEYVYESGNGKNGDTETYPLNPARAALNVTSSTNAQTYHWIQTAGPTATILDDSAENTSFISPAPVLGTEFPRGTSMTFQLIINEGEDNEAVSDPITVPLYLRGDANRNNIVNVTDCVYIRNAINGMYDGVYGRSADMNGSGIVDQDDMIISSLNMGRARPL